MPTEPRIPPRLRRKIADGLDFWGIAFRPSHSSHDGPFIITWRGREYVLIVLPKEKYDNDRPAD